MTTRDPRRCRSSPRSKTQSVRGTGFEPDGDSPGVRRFAPFRAVTPRVRIRWRRHVSHVRSRRSCAGPDSNHGHSATLRFLLQIRACSFTRSPRSLVHCAGPDLNRRTPTGQRPKRCAFGLARQPALTPAYHRPDQEPIALIACPDVLFALQTRRIRFDVRVLDGAHPQRRHPFGGPIVDELLPVEHRAGLR